jgi:hypothetical protein
VVCLNIGLWSLCSVQAINRLCFFGMKFLYITPQRHTKRAFLFC